MTSRLMLVVSIGALLHAGCRGVFGIEDSVGRADAALGGDALGGDARASPPPTLQFIGEWSSAADDSLFLFPTVPLGVANAPRHVIVASHTRSELGGFGAASILIDGGIAATRVISINEDTAGGAVALHIAAIPDSQTIADIVLTHAGTGGGDRRAMIGVWIASDLTSAAPLAVETVQSWPDPGSVMIEVAPRGIVVAAATLGSPSASATTTWTGATTAYAVVFDLSLGAAAIDTTSTAEMRTISFSSTDTVNSRRIVAASFR